MADGNGAGNGGNGNWTRDKGPIPFPGPFNMQGDHGTNVHLTVGGDAISESVKAFRNMGIMLMGIQSLTGILAGLALIVALWNHYSDVAAINEDSQWADLVYSRSVQIDAKLNAMGIPLKGISPIPQPPNRQRN